MPHGVVELYHVGVEFKVGGRRIRVLNDISLEIKPGEIITVVGESGCGKSTLGRVCLGTLKPTEGAVFYNGKYIWSESFKWTPEYRLMVQVIYQDPFASLNPVRTVYQTLETPMVYYHKTLSYSEIKAKIIKLLETVGLTPPEFFLNKYPFQLSGGQRQRVCIARTLILRPKLIIADEPVSGVDASSRINILNLMRELNLKYNISFLYITHDIATAKFFAPEGKILVMYLGRIVEKGIVKKCIENPRHPYFQALLYAVLYTFKKGEGRIPLKSFDLPSLFNPPSGCVFHPRCPYADGLCERVEPELKPLLDDHTHFVACHHIDKIPDFSQLISKS